MAMRNAALEAKLIRRGIRKDNQMRMLGQHLMATTNSAKHDIGLVGDKHISYKLVLGCCIALVVLCCIPLFV
jgi:hypothetical protein